MEHFVIACGDAINSLTASFAQRGRTLSSRYVVRKRRTSSFDDDDAWKITGGGSFTVDAGISPCNPLSVLMNQHAAIPNHMDYLTSSPGRKHNGKCKKKYSRFCVFQQTLSLNMEIYRIICIQVGDMVTLEGGR